MKRWVKSPFHKGPRNWRIFCVFSLLNGLSVDGERKASLRIKFACNENSLLSKTPMIKEFCARSASTMSFKRIKLKWYIIGRDKEHLARKPSKGFRSPRWLRRVNCIVYQRERAKNLASVLTFIKMFPAEFKIFVYLCWCDFSFFLSMCNRVWFKGTTSSSSRLCRLLSSRSCLNGFFVGDVHERCIRRAK